MGEPKPGVGILKALLGHKIKKGDDGRYTFTISTGSVDRDHDTIDPNGWRLGEYRRNPVVLFGHDARQPPIGKAAAVEVRSGALKADVVFAPEGVYPLADTVRGLVDAEILRATSVGFIPIKWTFDEERNGVDFLEQELYEFSIVPIPSNTEALRDATGVELAPLVEWAESTLDTVKGAGLWVPKADLEQMRKAMLGEPASVTVAGGEGQGETHAPAEPGSTPGPATPEPEPQPVVLRLLRSPRISTSFTREQAQAVIQNAVDNRALAAVRRAAGRLDD